MTVTSTYDHRIIQGAESGMFLKRVHELLLGEHDFYASVFESLGVPYEAVQWRVDQNPVNSEEVMLHKQMQVATLIRVHRVRGHLIADLDPLRWKHPVMPPELDPATYGLTIWDLDREFLTNGIGGRDRMALGDLMHLLRDAYCRTIGIEYMHIQDPDQRAWIQSRVERRYDKPPREEQLRILRRLNAAEAFETFLQTKYVGQKRFSLEGAESVIPLMDAVLSAAAEEGLDEDVRTELDQTRDGARDMRGATVEQVVAGRIGAAGVVAHGRILAPRRRRIRSARPTPRGGPARTTAIRRARSAARPSG